MSKKSFAEIILIFTAIIWALTYPFIRIVVAEMSPVVLMFWRGIIASAIFGLVIISKKDEYPLKKLFPAGCILGFFYYVSYLTQTIGLQTIDSGRSAFITSLYVVFVPLLSPLFRGSSPTKHDIISCMLAFVGLILLTDPFSHGSLKAGDFWTIIAAFCFAVQMLLIQIYTKRYHSYNSFAFLQTFIIGILSALTIPFTQNASKLQLFPKTQLGIIGFIYLAVFATAATTWLQARFQNETTPERASVIYALEPVIAMAFGCLLLNEVVSSLSLLGAALMLLAVFWGFIVNALKRN